MRNEGGGRKKHIVYGGVVREEAAGKRPGRGRRK